MQQLLYGSDPLQMKAGDYNNPQAVGELVQVPTATPFSELRKVKRSEG
jgi:hypothetical protein